MTEVEFAQAYPYDTATFVGTVANQRSDTGLGFNAGVDAVWYFSRHFGIGWLVRFTRGTVDLVSADGDNVSVDVGGVHGGLGLRLSF